MGKYFSLDRTDRIIAECIRKEYQRKRAWVFHDEIVKCLWSDPAGKDLAETAYQTWKKSIHKQNSKYEWRASPTGWASNMVQWFSQRITEDRSDYAGEFDRKQVGSNWAYQPKQNV